MDIEEELFQGRKRIQEQVRRILLQMHDLKVGNAFILDCIDVVKSCANIIRSEADLLDERYLEYIMSMPKPKGG